MVPPFHCLAYGSRHCLACRWYRGLCVPFSGSPCALGRNNQTYVEFSWLDYPVFWKGTCYVKVYTVMFVVCTMPNTHKNKCDPECQNWMICFAKASTCVPKLTWITEESLLWLCSDVSVSSLNSIPTHKWLDLASSPRLRIWSYPRDAGWSEHGCHWHFRSMSFDSSMTFIRNLYLFMGFIHLHELWEQNAEWDDILRLWQRPLQHTFQIFLSGNGPRLIDVTLAIVSLKDSSSPVYQRLILLPFGLFCFWQQWYSTVSHYVLYLICLNYCRLLKDLVATGSYRFTIYLPPFKRTIPYVGIKTCCRNSALHLRCLTHEALCGSTGWSQWFGDRSKHPGKWKE